MARLVVKNEHTCHDAIGLCAQHTLTMGAIYPLRVKLKSSSSLSHQVTIKVMIKKCSKRLNSQTNFISREPTKSYHNSKILW